MKILFACNNLLGGGAQKLINDLLPRMAQRGLDVSVIIISSDREKYIENLRKNNIEVHVMPEEASNHLKRIIYLKKYIEAHDFDIVHANLYPMFYYCSIVKMISKKKFMLVMTEHNTDNRRRRMPLLQPLESFIYGRYNKIISISEMTQENLLNWVKPKDIQRYVVIDNGVDVDSFRKASPFSISEIDESCDPGDIYIGMVGSFTEQKNHVSMINIMELLPENYKLVLVGEGKLQGEIGDLVNRKGLSARVIFLGFRHDVAEIMHSVDIIAIPSKWEGFGLIAVEAMACGKPVVAYDVPGLSEVLSDSALKSRLGDERGFADNIRCLETADTYNKYADLSSAMADKYDIDKMMESYIDVYKESMII